MRTVLCKAFGPPESLVVEEVDDLEAGPGQVVIDVHACALNFPDVLMIQDKYQFKPDLPFAPGGEVSGVVREIGEGVTGVAPGDRVIASIGAGGLAEQVRAPAGGLIPVPEGADMAEASGLLVTYGTSHHALKDRAKIQPGETMLVLGAAGGVGLSAVELGVAMGAVVFAAASTDEKLALCREHGAAATINYSTEDLRARVKELTDGQGVDVVYDPVGGDLSEPALRSMAWEGRFLVIGFAAGDIPRIPLNLPLLKGCSVMGVFYGSFAGREPKRNRANIAELVELWQAGKIRPHVSATYPLEKAGDAMLELAERRATGKVVVLTDAGAAGR